MPSDPPGTRGRGGPRSRRPGAPPAHKAAPAGPAAAARILTEFPRPLPLARVGPDGREERFEATPAEREALARRFDIPAVRSLRISFRLRQERDGSVLAEARLDAEVTQTCVVTLEPVDQPVSETLTLRLLAPGKAPSDGPEEIDEIESDAHGVVDLGEVAAEQLALALDPYPRAPGARLPPEVSEGTPGEEAGAESPSASGFAALAALRRR